MFILLYVFSTLVLVTALSLDLIILDFTFGGSRFRAGLGLGTLDSGLSIFFASALLIRVVVNYSLCPKG